MPTYTERVSYTCDNITPAESGGFLIGLKTVMETLRDGDVIASENHRQVLQPGDDISGLPDHVQAVCRGLWTPEAVGAWSAEQLQAIADAKAQIDTANAQRLLAIAQAESIEQLQQAFAARVSELQTAVADLQQQLAAARLEAGRLLAEHRDEVGGVRERIGDHGTGVARERREQAVPRPGRQQAAGWYPRTVELREVRERHVVAGAGGANGDGGGLQGHADTVPSPMQ